MTEKSNTAENQITRDPQHEPEGEARDENKTPTNPIPPPSGEALPIAVTGQIVQTLVSNCYIMEFDGDPANAAEIVKIIPEKEIVNAENTTTEGQINPHADTDPPPASSDEQNLFDTNIFCDLKPFNFDFSADPPALDEKTSNIPLFTNRPPDGGVYADIVNFRLNPPKKSEK